MEIPPPRAALSLAGECRPTAEGGKVGTACGRVPRASLVTETARESCYSTRLSCEGEIRGGEGESSNTPFGVE